MQPNVRQLDAFVEIACTSPKTDRAISALVVLEVNHSAEFRNSIEPTGVDLPALMVDHVLREAQERAA